MLREKGDTDGARAEAEQVKKTIAGKRIYEGGFRQDVKDRIAQMGLFRKVESRKEAAANAQALINDPELVILDEPTSGLDPLGTAWMKKLILDLRAKGKTVLMCSHRLDDVQDVCDRIAILYNGDLQELGAVSKLVSEGKSLLPIGVTDVVGDFVRGDVIAVKSAQGEDIARGLANYSAAEARLIARKPSSQIESLLGYTNEPELIHRDNLVLEER